MTDIASAARKPQPLDSSSGRPGAVGPVTRRRLGSSIPTWSLIATKQLELRKRHGLMAAAALLTLGVPALVLCVSELLHVADPRSYGPPGSPDVFVTLSTLAGEFGFIAAAVLGTAAATTDLSDGVFRHLVATGRSRFALYLARIPAGLSIVLPLVALSFTLLSLVTSYAGVPQPRSVAVNGVNGVPVAIPVHLDETQLHSWVELHAQQAALAFGPGEVRPHGKTNMTTVYGEYTQAQMHEFNPTPGEMVEAGLWLELEVAIGFMVGLGLGALTGQRTVSTVLLIALEIIVTPIAATHTLPHLLDAQRLVVGVAMNQLRPAELGSTAGGPLMLGAHGGPGIPPMPTWAMIAVIVGWLVGWSVIGAWSMVRRDA